MPSFFVYVLAFPYLSEGLTVSMLYNFLHLYRKYFARCLQLSPPGSTKEQTAEFRIDASTVLGEVQFLSQKVFTALQNTQKY